MLGLGVPTGQHTYTPRFIYVGALSTRIRDTRTNLLSKVGTLNPRIRSTHIYTRGGYSKSLHKEYHQHTYTSWFNYVGTISPRIRDTCTNLLSKVGTLSPRSRSTHTYTRGWVLSVLGPRVPRHILGVGTLNPRTRSTRTYTRGGYSES